MACLEVRKAGKLVRRRQVDDDKARRGCTVRLGSLGKVRIRLGETARMGEYDIALLDTVSAPEAEHPTHGAGRPPHMLTIGRYDKPLPASWECPDIVEIAQCPDLAGYKIIEQLAEGGIGTAWRAVQLSTQRQVTLKLIRNQFFESETARARFTHAIAMVGRLIHPNIARIYESGLHEGVHFCVMELVKGVHLDRFVREHELDQRGVLSLMKKICLAVEYAHGQGIIHRDLKPANILVTPDGEPHILNFGLANVLEDESKELIVSMTGQVIGTLPFMSPEQAEGNIETLDERSDVYSLGVILYQMLTGTLPRDMRSARPDVRRRIMEEEVIRPRSVDRRISRDLESILLRALALRPDDRYDSAGDLARDIEGYLGGETGTAPGISKVDRTPKALRHSPRKVLSTLYLCIAIMAAGGAIWFFLVRYTAMLDHIELQRRDNEQLQELVIQAQNERGNVSPGDFYRPRGQRPGRSTTPDTGLRDRNTRNVLPYSAYQQRGQHLDLQGTVETNRRNQDALERIMRLEVLARNGNWAEGRIVLNQLQNDYRDTYLYKFHEPRIRTWEDQIRKGLTMVPQE